MKLSRDHIILLCIQCQVALLKTQIESQKVESIKYLAGGIFSIVTIILSLVLGLWRLMK